MLEVFDPVDTLLFSGTLNAGNGGAVFDTVFPSPLNNVSRVRLSGITNLLPFQGAVDIIWRELWAIQDLNPAIDLEKTVSGPEPLMAGDVISYSFVVTNAGDTTLTNVTVTDPLPDLSAIACPDTTLAPAAVMTCTATYTVTPADVASGFVANTATVTGDPPTPLAQVSAQDSATIPPEQLRRIELEKTASAPDSNGEVTYSFEVTNTGNVTLSSVTVTDPLPGLSTISCPGTTLAPTISMTRTATYPLTQADVDAGFVTNTVTAEGTPPSGGPVSDQDSATVNAAVGIALTKTGSGPGLLTAGATVLYSFEVTNIGQLELTSVTVTDPLPGLSTISCPGTTLAPGASMTCTASYTVTPADVAAGAITNTATAEGTPPNGLSPVSAESTASVPPAPAPAPVPALPSVIALLLMAWLTVGALRTLRRARE